MYKGIYEVIGINPNNVDYIIRQVDGEKKKSQPFQIHKNRLRYFFGHFLTFVKGRENNGVDTDNKNKGPAERREPLISSIKLSRLKNAGKKTLRRPRTVLGASKKHDGARQGASADKNKA